MSESFKSGTPIFACDADLRIVLWNDAAEKLTGVEAEEAVGRRCWQVLRGHDDRGSLVCHRGCSHARLAREGWPVSSHFLNTRMPQGPQRLGVDVVSVADGSSSLMLHVLRPAPKEAEPDSPVGGRVNLTRRQRDVLSLLDEGLRAREIADRLGVSLPTVRNHIHAILVELGAHSQVEALAVAKKHLLL